MYLIAYRYPITVLKHLLPSCCHKKNRPEKISFNPNDMKRNASVYFFSLQFTAYIVVSFEIHKFVNYHDGGSSSYLREMQPLSIITDKVSKYGKN